MVPKLPAASVQKDHKYRCDSLLLRMKIPFITQFSKERIALSCFVVLERHVG